MITLDPSEFFPGLHIIDRIDPQSPRLTLQVQLDQVGASCPACGVRSARVHSHYHRSIGDVPCLGRQLVLRVRIRRFRCINAVCRKRTFAEHPSTIAQSRARHTDRLRTLHHAVVLALGGNAGARMAGTMAIPVGATTLLRRIRQAPLECIFSSISASCVHRNRPAMFMETGQHTCKAS
ncbi:transposase family protein (plasmid) [Skermanella mucosa]|uniref:transposase family protein n=1 Tax=Skermanella mucosa TaxID=1789672 RepID=UPI00192BBB15|nr:transposase family protein [Skermanella mucosa]UEM24357.1 transposase family protein [Skermanella mucosa]